MYNHAVCLTVLLLLNNCARPHGSGNATGQEPEPAEVVDPDGEGPGGNVPGNNNDDGDDDSDQEEPAPLMQFDEEDPGLCPTSEPSLKWTLKHLEVAPGASALIVQCDGRGSNPEQLATHAKVVNLESGTIRFTKDIPLGYHEYDYSSFADGRLLLLSYIDDTLGESIKSMDDGHELAEYHHGLVGFRAQALTNLFFWEFNDYGRAVNYFHDVASGAPRWADEDPAANSICYDEDGVFMDYYCNFFNGIHYEESPDGQYFFVGNRGNLTSPSEVHDSGSLLMNFQAHTQKYLDLPELTDPSNLGPEFQPDDTARFARDSRHLLKIRTGGDHVKDRGIKLLTLPDANLVKAFPSDGQEVLGFSGDGRRFVFTRKSDSLAMTRIFNADTGEQLVEIPGYAANQDLSQGLVWIPTSGKVYDVEADDVPASAFVVEGDVIFIRQRDRDFIAWREGDCSQNSQKGGFVDLFYGVTPTRVIDGNEDDCAEVRKVAFNLDNSMFLVEGVRIAADRKEHRFVVTFATRTGDKKTAVATNVPYDKAWVLSDGHIVLQRPDRTVVVY